MFVSAIAVLHHLSDPVALFYTLDKAKKERNKCPGFSSINPEEESEYCVSWDQAFSTDTADNLWTVRKHFINHVMYLIGSASY